MRRTHRLPSSSSPSPCAPPPRAPLVAGLLSGLLAIGASACGAPPERGPAPRAALGGAPNVPRAHTSGVDAALEDGMPELAPGESFVIVQVTDAGTRARRATRHIFDGACTNLWGSGDYGEDTVDAAPGTDPAVTDPDTAEGEAEPPADDGSLLPSDDLEVHLHLMPPLAEQPADGAVIEHTLVDDTSGTYVLLSDFKNATSVSLEHATIKVGPSSGDGRLVTVESESADGVVVVAGFRLASGEAY